MMITPFFYYTSCQTSINNVVAKLSLLLLYKISSEDIFQKVTCVAFIIHSFSKFNCRRAQKKNNCRCMGCRQEEFWIILTLIFQTMLPRHSLDISIKYSYVPQVRPSTFFSLTFSLFYPVCMIWCFHAVYMFSTCFPCSVVLWLINDQSCLKRKTGIKCSQKLF